MPETTPSFSTRLGLALRLLFDARFATQMLVARQPIPETLPPVTSEPEPTTPNEDGERDLSPALQLLELLQREGRLLDFLRQDIVKFADSDVGAAARIVHQGCRKALDQTVSIEPVRPESEGAPVVLDEGFDSRANRLTGSVQGHPPYRGTLKHKGWRVTQITLAQPLAGADLHVVAPAEIEL